MITRTQLAPSLQKMAELMRNGATPSQIAEFVNASEYPVALSHYIEDKAEEGTFAAAVFDVLCEA